jgi:hypothetical protein
VSSGAILTRAPSITVWPTPDEKRRFAALALHRGASESRLALIAIRALLESNAPPPPSLAPTPTRESAADRITIRLRPGDRRAVNERAARRGMKTSAYLAALVRAHVGANPPLAAGELTVLKKTVVVLATLAGEVRQFIRRLPPALTDKEMLAVDFIRHLETQKSARTPHPKRARDRGEDLTR